MSIPEEEVNDIRSMIDIGIFSYTLISMVGFALRNNKPEFVSRLNILMTEFENSLQETEKQTLKTEINNVVNAKMDEFIKELESKYPKEDVDNLLKRLQEERNNPQT